jgi:hypothetical protein
MPAFSYQWSNLVMMIFKQIIIAILIIMMFVVDLNPIRETIHPMFSLPGAVLPRAIS